MEVRSTAMEVRNNAIRTVAEKGHQLLLPFGDSAMEPCNGSAQLNNYSTMQSHFAYRGHSGLSYIDTCI